MQILRLPFPPSANNLFINVKRGGRIKSPEYRAWITEAGHLLNLQKPKPITGRAKVLITAVRPDKRKRDIANLEKPILDLLVTHKILEDDSLVESLTLEWVSDNLSGVSITITPLDIATEATRGITQDEI
jgi:crossover junction endodeoxyribonuclease RusA